MKHKFITVGFGLFLILSMYTIAGMVDEFEAREKFKHCIFQHIDEVYTDQQAHDMDEYCANRSGYR